MNYSNSPAYLLSIVSAAWFTLMAYRFQKSLAFVLHRGSGSGVVRQQHLFGARARRDFAVHELGNSQNAMGRGYVDYCHHWHYERDNCCGKSKPH